MHKKCRKNNLFRTEPKRDLSFVKSCPSVSTTEHSEIFQNVLQKANIFSNYIEKGVGGCQRYAYCQGRQASHPVFAKSTGCALQQSQFPPSPHHCHTKFWDLRASHRISPIFREKVVGHFWCPLHRYIKSYTKSMYLNSTNVCFDPAKKII